MQVDQRLADRQPEPEPAEQPGHVPPALLERVEDPRQRLGVDPDAGVADGDGQSPAGRVGRPDRHPPAGRRELDRVLQQVPQDLLGPGRVGPDVVPPGRQVQRQLDLLRPGVVRAPAGHVPHLLVQVDRLDVQVQLPLPDPGQVQDVVDQPGLELDVPADHRHPLPHVRRGRGVGLDHLHGRQHGRQRGPQLVAEDGQEPVLGRARPLRLGPGLPLGLVQAGPLQRLGALAGERQQEVLVVGRERVGLVEPEPEHADRGPADHERDARRRLRLPHRPDGRQRRVPGQPVRRRLQVDWPAGPDGVGQRDRGVEPEPLPPVHHPGRVPGRPDQLQRRPVGRHERQRPGRRACGGDPLVDDDGRHVRDRQRLGQRLADLLRPAEAVGRPLGPPQHLGQMLPLAGQLLGPVAEGGLVPPAVADVPEHAGERRRAVGQRAGDRQLDRELGPVLADGRHLQPPAEDRPVPGRQVRGQPVPVRVPQGRRDDQLGHLPPDGLGGRVPERPLGGRVPLDDAAAVVHRDDAVEGGLEDGRVTGLARPQRLLRPPPADRLPELPADDGHHVEQRLVRRADVAAEELEHPEHPPAGRHREPGGRVQPGRRGRRPAGEVVVRRHVGDPDRGVRRPHPPGQPDARPERRLPAGRLERGRVVGRRAPRLRPPDHVLVRVDLPQPAALPPGRAADGLQHPGDGLPERRGLGQHPGDRVLGHQPGLGQLPVGPVPHQLGEPDELAGLVSHGHQHPAGEEPGPVPADVPPLVRRPPVPGRRRHLLLRHATPAVLGREDHVRRPADDLRLGVPEDPLGPVVPARDAAGHVRHEDRVVRDVLDEEAVAVLDVEGGVGHGVAVPRNRWPNRRGGLWPAAGRPFSAVPPPVSTTCACPF
ncbi:MAG: hypothetical protein AVDCRST_MAG64-500 [uncultured Phycisphaerae bacterium]|uniref:Uncharacterized protein n=1 Tax=uncultured Phycisphaerae bacterium TaxID=904963 RepID=A0A6J4N8Q3_9BACT|nr:MAG: hypothetical protein AVDCRST_MAG64-500 [uncultured Phycisphaerae bacterium]